jgi:DNA-binding IclR family transcriptional regulator
MGRKANQERIQAVLRLVSEHDGRMRAADIARELGVPKSSITRLLPAIDEGETKRLTEDDLGFLGIFKR